MRFVSTPIVRKFFHRVVVHIQCTERDKAPKKKKEVSSFVIAHDDKPKSAEYIIPLA